MLVLFANERRYDPLRAFGTVLHGCTEEAWLRWFLFVVELRDRLRVLIQMVNNYLLILIGRHVHDGPPFLKDLLRSQ